MVPSPSWWCRAYRRRRGDADQGLRSVRGAGQDVALAYAHDMRVSPPRLGLRALALGALLACGLPPTGTLASTDFSSISAGVDHTCALTPAGAAACWGRNDAGQSEDQAGPYTEVSAGGFHDCALTTTGAADCWGSNADGEATDHAGPFTEVVAGWR